eukprot:TRINITY_DN105_c11_g1_i1.p1 TRINITY_DN105_c11_g1~~TRINITY_DN105_c11_g1_i1.p1  ORF type:complete len:105 (+),score=3.65 TRINITY_DN105_c11_g1_i1:257-571(+)
MSAFLTSSFLYLWDGFVFSCDVGEEEFFADICFCVLFPLFPVEGNYKMESFVGNAHLFLVLCQFLFVALTLPPLKYCVFVFFIFPSLFSSSVRRKRKKNKEGLG